MTPTMPADRKQVEEARTWLQRGADSEAHWCVVHVDALRILLTDHAALLARAEAAETNFKAALFLLPDADILRLKADGLVGGMKARILSEAREIDALRAAHQPPAPVKAGGEV